MPSDSEKSTFKNHQNLTVGIFFFVHLWQSMTLKDAIKSSLTILKQVMEEKLNATNIEVRLSFLTHFGFVCEVISVWKSLNGRVSCRHCSSVSPVAGNSRAWEDLPYVFQRRAGGCNQGYLKQKRLVGRSGRGSTNGLNVTTQPQLSISIFSLWQSDLNCIRGFSL